MELWGFGVFTSRMEVGCIRDLRESGARPSLLSRVHGENRPQSFHPLSFQGQLGRLQSEVLGRWYKHSQTGFWKHEFCTHLGTVLELAFCRARWIRISHLRKQPAVPRAALLSLQGCPPGRSVLVAPYACGAATLRKWLCATLLGGRNVLEC